MSRLSRINTIWRKELIDTLRDRRTLIAMILVPIVLYPAMILGSLQGFELQVSRLRQEQYKIGVMSEGVRTWLRHLIDTDASRQPGAAPDMPAEELIEETDKGELAEDEESAVRDESPTDAARESVRAVPPDYRIEVVSDPELMVKQILMGELHAGVALRGRPPTAAGDESAPVTLLMDQTEIRSQMAAAGLEGVFDRADRELLRQRLRREDLADTFVRPIELVQETVATPEKVGGSILGQIVPLILIIMTITGAIYPAIDLTAGERERGTLETLMVAPVPTVDLIAGKFVVVALIGMLSAALNLLSIGGTIYLGGLGRILTQDSTVVIPLQVLPWVLVVLIPLAVMFSAVLLAVCSFARSFKEAQNYVMPVMVAALIPAVVGALPGMRLEGPLLIMPVTNIVILTRDLFTGQFSIGDMLWVTLSTTMYAGAAVAVAAKLFGQEAVLFADSGSIKTIFQRRFFKPTTWPNAAQAFLLIAAVFSANFFIQQSLLARPGVFGTMWYWFGLAAVILGLFVGAPLALCLYARINIRETFALRLPPISGWLAALCFGSSIWILGQAWLGFQRTWLPIPPEYEQAFGEMLGVLQQMNPLVVVFFVALVPAIGEELFFRGFALNGLRGALGTIFAVLIVAFAFGANHHSIHRLLITSGLGVLFCVLVIRFESIYPAMLAHLLNNGLAVLVSREDALQPLLNRLGYVVGENGLPPLPWVIGALGITLIGVLICMFAGRRKPEPLREPNPI